MWWLGPIIGGALINIASTLIGRVLVGLGLGIATYTGMSASLNWLKASMVSSLLALPPSVVGMLSMMKVGSCVSMLFSAMIVKMTLNGMTSDTVKSWVKK